MLATCWAGRASPPLWHHVAHWLPGNVGYLGAAKPECCEAGGGKTRWRLAGAVWRLASLRRLARAAAKPHATPKAPAADGQRPPPRSAPGAGPPDPSSSAYRTWGPWPCPRWPSSAACATVGPDLDMRSESQPRAHVATARGAIRPTCAACPPQASAVKCRSSMVSTAAWKLVEERWRVYEGLSIRPPSLLHRSLSLPPVITRLTPSIWPHSFGHRPLPHRHSFYFPFPPYCHPRS